MAAHRGDVQSPVRPVLHAKGKVNGDLGRLPSAVGNVARRTIAGQGLDAILRVGSSKDQPARHECHDEGNSEKDMASSHGITSQPLALSLYRTEGCKANVLVEDLDLRKPNLTLATAGFAFHYRYRGSMVTSAATPAPSTHSASRPRFAIPSAPLSSDRDCEGCRPSCPTRRSR